MDKSSIEVKTFVDQSSSSVNRMQALGRSKASHFYSVGSREKFKTIQSAIDFAHANGGGTIYLEPGETYYENLVFRPGITLEGCGIADLRFIHVHGKHLLPEQGELGFNHILFSNDGSIFDEPSIGAPNLLFRSCVFEVKNGYVLNIPNMNGTVIFFDCCSAGENNGFINNINGNCNPTVFNITIDGGRNLNKMYINSSALFFNVHFKVEAVFSGTNSVVTINGGSWIENTFELIRDNNLRIANSNIETRNEPAFYIYEGAALALDNCSVESSATEVLQGSGTIRLGNVCFPLQSRISENLQVINASIHHHTLQKVGESGAADPLPKNPSGYIKSKINGRECLIPYYEMPSN